jgi:hypothetical protein
VNVSKVFSTRNRLAIVPRIGGVFWLFELTATVKLRLSLKAGNPSSVTRTVIA